MDEMLEWQPNPNSYNTYTTSAAVDCSGDSCYITNIYNLDYSFYILS